MQHQFVIGVSGYTAFPAIGDPTPVRLLPPPVDPKRFVRRSKRKAFASWDEKVRLMQTWNVVDKFPLSLRSNYMRVRNYGIPPPPPPPPPQVRGRWGEEPTAQQVFEHAMSSTMNQKRALEHLCSRRELLARAKMNGITVEEQEARDKRDQANVAVGYRGTIHCVDDPHADQSIVGKRGRGEW